MATINDPSATDPNHGASNPAAPAHDGGATSWAALDQELGRWQASDATASFWWRDDDATEPSPALDRLLAIATKESVPVAIASVPKFLSAGLPASLRAHPAVRAIQHGFAHRNHAVGAGGGAWELGLHRGTEPVLAELVTGREIMRTAFAGQFIPVVAAPWNRIDRRLLPGLRDRGFIGVSAFGERAPPPYPKGFVEANTHLDLLSWKGTPRFRGEAAALKAIVDHLGRRRLGLADRDEPTGILSHHLVLDEAAWRFLADFIAFVARHPGACWQSASDVFGPGGSA